MSHIRSNLGIEDRLYLSVTGIAPAAHAATPLPQSAWSRIGRTIAARLASWQAHRRARRDLALLDTRSLRDLGLSPEHIAYELNQPFWRPLRNCRQ